MDSPHFGSSSKESDGNSSLTPETSRGSKPSRVDNVHVRRLFDTDKLNCMSHATVLQGNSHSVPSRPPTQVPSRPPVDGRMDDILQELREANSRLSTVTNRLSFVEGRLKGLEEASMCSTSTGSEVRR